ncbi:hypothetical protein SteCoe_10726 [Stentor coeruleus]|uniref:FHA domain-containing protein n=1 Tax=Stentor coeruleus TaxID=5963 RepID=A0A1R2CEW1_9CILI|nr:hypothetical protein SteCoe_10726 [Stentor coeruleus]
MNDNDELTLIDQETSSVLSAYLNAHKTQIIRITNQWDNILSSSIIPRSFPFKSCYDIKYTLKSTRPHSERIQTLYIPKKPKIKIGCIDCDLIIQTSFNAILHIELNENRAKVSEEYIESVNRSNFENIINRERKVNLCNRIEVSTMTKIYKGDIYRIGRTNIEILEVNQSEICMNFFERNTDDFFRFIDSFYICRKFEEVPADDKLFIDDEFIAKKHAFVSKMNNEWMIQNLNTNFITWKYFVNSRNIDRFSFVCNLMPGQKIHMNGSRVWLESRDSY